MEGVKKKLATLKEEKEIALEKVEETKQKVKELEKEKDEVNFCNYYSTQNE